MTDNKCSNHHPCYEAGECPLKEQCKRYKETEAEVAEQIAQSMRLAREYAGQGNE